VVCHEIRNRTDVREKHTVFFFSKASIMKRTAIVTSASQFQGVTVAAPSELAVVFLCGWEHLP
jgi:hypothetical protein